MWYTTPYQEAKEGTAGQSHTHKQHQMNVRQHNYADLAELLVLRTVHLLLEKSLWT